MAKKDTRIIMKQSEDLRLAVNSYIFVDKETGVNYLFVQSGYSGGLTPLLNADGTVVVTPVDKD